MALKRGTKLAHAFLKLKIITKVSCKWFRGWRLLKSEELIASYTFEDFLAHLCCCFSNICQISLGLDSDSETNRRQGLMKMLQNCFLVEDIDLEMLIDTFEHLQKEGTGVLFGYVSSQILATFYNPDTFLYENLKAISKRLVKSGGMISTILVEEINKTEKSEIKEALNQFIYSEKSLEYFWNINNCLKMQPQKRRSLLKPKYNSI